MLELLNDENSATIAAMIVLIALAQAFIIIGVVVGASISATRASSV